TKKVLISVKNMKFCGWVPPDVLLLPQARIDRSAYRDGPPAMQVKESPFGKRDPSNTLTLKIVLQNIKIRGEEGAPVFDTPGGRRTPGSQLFNIYEVFRIAEAPDPETKKQTRYYLAGWTPQGGGATGHKKLRGWVREDDALAWV